ncbi:MAG: PaaI family thioesterase [Salinivirgaceae bacterium]|nr:PaaI family thioesterase [Salinivirgaceae bacterium]
MKKIINPWKDKDIFSCFGCSEKNKFGLHLEFFDNGEGIECTWLPNKEYEGYINTLHGGIQSTLHDEIASWVIYTKGATAGVTTELNVKFLKGVLVDEGEIKITGQLIEKDKKYMTIHTKLFNSKDELCSEAKVVYRVFSPQVAMAKMHYPGVEAFYEKES